MRRRGAVEDDGHGALLAPLVGDQLGLHRQQGRGIPERDELVAHGKDCVRQPFGASGEHDGPGGCALDGLGLADVELRRAAAARGS